MAKGTLRPDRKRINVTFDIETYNQIKLVAEKNNQSLSETVASWVIEGLNGTLNRDNLDFLLPVIREQLRDILAPGIERLASLSAKTCVQAGAAAYLSAECISKFVPVSEQMDMQNAYNKARIKAVDYMRSHVDLSSAFKEEGDV